MASATTKGTQGALAFKLPKTGVSYLFTTVWTVKPGHQKQMREAILKFAAIQDPARVKRVFIPTGVHAANLTLFDNDTRFYAAFSFDTEWDAYMADIFRLSNNGSFHYDLFVHLEGGPTMSQKEWTVDDFKSIFLAHQAETLAYLVTVPDITTGETVKAQRLMKAFQQVLDNPKAAEALQHPALKPLLDEAAA